MKTKRYKLEIVHKSGRLQRFKEEADNISVDGVLGQAGGGGGKRNMST